MGKINWREEFRKNLIFAWPIILTQLGQVVVNFVDNIMVGKLGPTDLAAVSLSNAMFILFLIFGIGLAFAGTPLYASADEQKDYKRLGDIFASSFIINIVYAVLAGVVFYSSTYYFTELNQPLSVIPKAEVYARISAFTLIPFMLFLSYRGFSDGLSRPILILKATITGNIINIGLNYLLIYGNHGFPRLESKGAAIATLIARCVMVLVVTYQFYHWDKFRKVYSEIKNRVSNYVFKELLQLGLPSALSGLFEVGAFAASAFIIGTIGELELAAHQIAINLASITFLICTALSVTASVRIGNGVGKKDVAHIYRAGVSNLMMIVAFMIVCAIVLVVFKDIFPVIYIEDTQVISIASGLLVIAALFQISDGVQIVLMGALRGVKDVNVPTFITFFAYWVVALPLGYYLGIIKGYSAAGVWIGLFVGLTIAAILLVYRFFQKIKKLKNEFT